MKIALIAALSGALLAVGAQALPSAIGASDDSTDALVQPAASRTVEDDGARREDRRADRRKDRRADGGSAAGVDVSGPCDEAEHRNDPRCAGVQVPEDRGNAPAQNGVDISGPCDEAEHANDPRCTGAAPQNDRGGRVDDDRGGDDRVDNSGPGSLNSGHGSDDDGDDDGSGHGRGRGRGGDDD